MFENPRTGRQARNFTTNDPKIVGNIGFSEQIYNRKQSLGALEEMRLPKQTIAKIVDVSFAEGISKTTNEEIPLGQLVLKELNI